MAGTEQQLTNLAVVEPVAQHLFVLAQQHLARPESPPQVEHLGQDRQQEDLVAWGE